MRTQKIAILGGTFNPVHLGHLQIATSALAQFQLQRVLWVPIQHPVHKLRQANSASFEQRIEMVRLAVANQASFELCFSDLASAPSYAIDMIRALQALHPQSQWYWIIGQDALLTLPQWKGRQQLAETCCWLVAPRSDPANPAEAQAETICQQVEQAMLEQDMPIQWQVIQMPPVLVSSSLIRQRCQQERSIGGTVPDEVEQYILAHRLYRTG